MKAGVLLFCILLLGSVLVVADHPDDHGHGGHDDGGSHGGTIEATHPIPNITVTVHEDPLSGHNVQVETTDYIVSPEHASTAHVDGEGHHHLYLDGEKKSRFYCDWIHVSGLSEGTHEAKVTLSANTHAEYTHDGNILQDVGHFMVHDHGGHGHGHGATERNVSGHHVPTIDLVVHKDPASGYNLEIRTEHFTYAPERASTEHVDGEGHLHLTVNGERVARFYCGWFHIPDLPPGMHEVRVAMSGNDHIEYAIEGDVIDDIEMIHVMDPDETPVPEQKSLVIKDVDVKVGGSSDNNLQDGDRISKEAEPGDEVRFDIEVENLLEELEIEDIEVEVTIEDIDDGDDFDEEAREFDLDDGKDDDVTLEFDIPLEVGDGDYDVLITVEGEDENGTSHEDSMRLILEVEKENHRVLITRTSLNPEQLSCQRTAEFSFTLVNAGEDDEEDIHISIRNPELDLNVEDIIDLDEGDFDDDQTYSSSVTVRAEDVEEGVYPVTLRVEYDDGDEVETVTRELHVKGCEHQTTSVQEKQQDVEVRITSQPPLKGSIPLVTDVATKTTSKEILTPTPALLATMLGLGVIVLLVFMALLIALIRR